MNNPDAMWRDQPPEKRVGRILYRPPFNKLWDKSIQKRDRCLFFIPTPKTGSTSIRREGLLSRSKRLVPMKKALNLQHF